MEKCLLLRATCAGLACLVDGVPLLFHTCVFLVFARSAGGEVTLQMPCVLTVATKPE